MRVRIAIAVNADGEWCCGGYQWRQGDGLAKLNDDDAAGHAIDGLASEGHTVVFVEADIPLPQTVTVEGVAVGGPTWACEACGKVAGSNVWLGTAWRCAEHGK